jgi:hypothetical protein
VKKEVTPRNPTPEVTLPLFYKQPVLLRFEEHGNSGLAAPHGFAFAREAVAVPLGAGEFRQAIRHYPIVFSSEDTPTPLAVLGVRQGDNLFVDGNGSWQTGTYVPAYVRRYPFIITETPDQTAQLLAIDAQSDRFAAVGDRTDAIRLFDDAGAPTPAARSAMDLCRSYHDDHLKTAVFVEAIADARLLTPNRAEMQFPDGSRYTLDGFLSVDEVAFRALPHKTVAEWHGKGWLDLIALHMAAQQNWQGLMDMNALRNNKKEAA